MSRETSSDDGRGADDPAPLDITSDSFDSANEEMDSVRQEDIDDKHDNDSNEDEKNGTKRMKSSTGVIKKSTNNTQILDKSTENDFQQVFRRKRKEKISDDKVCGEGWIANSVYTTFFIEPKPHDDKSNELNKKIHIMEVAKILHNVQVKNYKTLTEAGRNRFKVTFDKPKQAETLINSTLLSDTFRYNVYVPNMFKQTIGVLRNIPPSLSEQEIEENLTSSRKIQKVERIKKLINKTLIPTYSVKIFVEGDKLPEEVKLYGITAKVEVYIFPLRVCFNCWRYGHKAKACKGKVRCKSCGLEHNDKECKSTVKKCVHCYGAHGANDPNCPERFRQDKIRTAMANHKLTFSEANKQYPKINTSQHFRLQSNNDFPPLSPKHDSQTTNQNVNQISKPIRQNSKPKFEIHKNSFPQPEVVKEPVHEFKENPHKVTEIEKLKQELKVEIMNELCKTGIFDKIKNIQNMINVQTSKDISDWNSDLLLININEELQSILKAAQ